jgi:type VI protein secretion system component VasF
MPLWMIVWLCLAALIAGMFYAVWRMDKGGRK